MNKWKIYALVMSFLTLGALKETFRILTSDAPDIAENRAELIPLAVLFSVGFLALAIRFWKKSSNPL